MANLEKGFSARELDGIYFVLSEMIKRSGHGLAYEINKNLFEVKKVLTSFLELEKEAKENFFEKDKKGKIQKWFYKSDLPLRKVEKGEKTPPGFKVGPKIKDGLESEFLDLVNKFEKERLNVKFTQLDENKIRQALEKGILDGLDLTPIFEVLI